MHIFFFRSQNIHKPFIVQTPKGNVEVLNFYQFNVESYSDDSTFATALMEGAVKDNRRQLSVPTQT